MSSTRLRPLMPRPNAFSFQNPNFPTTWLSCGSDYVVKKETPLPLVSTRWNPTPEQLQALEEMYRRGTRTPSAEQIQQIAAKLRRFGKIEGKNVFYWFQNHKARERQKKRRHEMELLAGKKIHQDHETLEKCQQGMMNRRRYFEETEQPSKLPPPSNCSTPFLQQKSASMVGSSVEEFSHKDEWTELGHEELQTKSCWQLDLSSCLSPIHKKLDLGQVNSDPFVPIQHGLKENQTLLQLFPLNSSNEEEEEEENNDDDVSRDGDDDSVLLPNQFFEFLPIRN